MVWALILALVLAFPVPAMAEEVEREAPSVDTDSSEYRDDSYSDVVPLEDVLDLVGEYESSDSPVWYDADSGAVLMVEDPPESVSVRSVSGSPYSSVTTGTYTDLASAIVPRLGWGDSYLFYRSGQYEYKMIYGSMQLNGTRFSGSDCTVVTWTQTTQQYNNYYTQTVSTGESVNVDAGSYIVWSNLGHYPVLAGEYVGVTSLSYVVWLLVIMSLIRPIYDWVMRTGVAVYGKDSH